MPPIQWFPGHMTKARRLIAEAMPSHDVVIEVLDARLPRSSENPLLTELRRLFDEEKHPSPGDGLAPGVVVANRHHHRTARRGAEDPRALSEARAPSTTKREPVEHVKLFTRLTAHLTSGFRLRRSMGTSKPRPAAILSAHGKMLRAENDDGVVAAREALRDTALGFERARTKKMRADVDRAREQWRPHTQRPERARARGPDPIAHGAHEQGLRLRARTLGLDGASCSCIGPIARLDALVKRHGRYEPTTG